MFYAGRWKEAEHINVQELRTVVGLLRHLVRGRENWRRRVLLFVDSMVALGALGKGRSSSPALAPRDAAAAALRHQRKRQWLLSVPELHPRVKR